MPPRKIPDPFYLVVADHERRVFSVEGPMRDDTRWNCAVMRVQDEGLQINCDAALGVDRARAVANYKRDFDYTEVSSGSIVQLGHDD